MTPEFPCPCGKVIDVGRTAFIVEKQNGDIAGSSVEFAYFDAPKPWVSAGRTQLGGPWWEVPLQTGSYRNLPVKPVWWSGVNTHLPTGSICVPPTDLIPWPSPFPHSIRVDIKLEADGGHTYIGRAFPTYFLGLYYFGTVTWVGTPPPGDLSELFITPGGFNDVLLGTPGLPPQPRYACQLLTYCPPVRGQAQSNRVYSPAVPPNTFGAFLSVSVLY